MIPSFEPRIVALIIGFVIIGLNGCTGTSPVSKYYLLSAMSDSADAAADTADSQDLHIGVGPVHLPKYLDRPQIVVRTKGNETRLAQFERWAEPLDVNFSRVLAENLAYLLHTDYLHIHPWTSRVKIDYQVSMHVFRFDVTDGKQAILKANWRILSGTDRSIRVQKNAVIHRTIGSTAYPEAVAALNAALEDLCRDIAENIQSLDQNPRERVLR